MVAAGAGHKDVPDEVKSKEDISDEPVKSTPSAKKQSTGIVSILNFHCVFHNLPLIFSLAIQIC